MRWLYGLPVSHDERAELLDRLRQRKTRKALFAAETLSEATSRWATAETAALVQAVILEELRDWPDLETRAPRLADVYRRLADDQQDVFDETG